MKAPQPQTLEVITVNHPEQMYSSFPTRMLKFFHFFEKHFFL